MRGLLLMPIAAAFLASLAAGSCTVATGPSFPTGAVAVPPSFATVTVAGLPAACSGQVYYEASTSLCPPALTYFLCDGSSYTEYDCSAPGAGWTGETLSEYDRVASAPAACPDTFGASPSGAVYVEGNVASPGQSSVLVFRYCDATLPALLVGRYSTGGSGAANLYDRGILDADQQVVVNGDGTLLFAVNQGSDSIAAYHIASDGLLSPVAGSPFPSGGVAPASVGVSGDILVVANKAVDGIRDLSKVAPNYATFRIGSSGALTATGSTYALAVGASPTQAFIAPGGKLLFGTEESGVLRAFQLSSSGELKLAPGSPVSLPSSLFTGSRPDPVWPAGLSASPNAEVLYTGIPNNDTIATFDFTADGDLSVVGGERDHNAFLPCWSVVSADGRRLYFANAGSDNISVWDIETDARHPSLLQSYELPGGGNPWGLRIDPTGTVLFTITPRQIHQIPQSQGQLLHGLQLASDGTIVDVLPGSPVTLPIPPGTNAFGVAVVGR